jgi:large subunit ribosomal protein L25
VYGHKQTPLPVAVPSTEFMHAVKHGAHLLELQLSDHSETVLVKEIQYDHLDSNPVHVDFSRVDLNERVTISVPLLLRGTPVGVTAGGFLNQMIKEIEIECLVTDIPDQIRYNVSKMELNQSLKASEIALPEGATLITSPDTLIASVALIAEEEAAVTEAAEGSAEPEVITKGKEKEEGEEGEEKA